MKNLIMVLFILGLTTPMLSQIVELPDLEITAVNYKYLSTVSTDVEDPSVKLLEEKVAMYDLKNSDLYVDEYSTYTVSFYIPNGSIVAAYDGNGKITRTIERFTNIKLPMEIRNKVALEFPKWSMTDDVYKVEYADNKGLNKKQYKIKLVKSGKTIRIKMDAGGNIL